jgi:hypothetical protein
VVRQQFEPMSVGQIIDQTFKLYKMNFVRFITIVAVIYIPIGLITTVGQSLLVNIAPQPGTVTIHSSQNPTSLGTPAAIYAKNSHGQPGQVDPGKMIVGGILTLVGAVLSLIGYFLCAGALMKFVSETYLGNNPTVGQVYSFVLPKIGTIVLAAFLTGLVVMLGFFLLIVPGVIFSLWYWLTAQVVVMENLPATQAMSRSKALTSGNLGKIFAVGLVVSLIAMVISGVISGAGGAISSLFMIQGNFLLMNMVNGLFSSVAQIIALPLSTAAAVLVYYDLRIRKEGFDLEMLARSMAPAEHPA